MAIWGADAHNPYLAARHVHNERYLSLTKGIRHWQLMAAGELRAIIALVYGLVSVTSTQQITLEQEAAV